MSTDALLTLLGLIAAVYALLTPEARLNLRMRIRPLDLSVMVSAFVIINLIKFTPVGTAVGIPALGPWRWGLDADLASYLIILVVSVFVWARMRIGTWHPRRIGTLRDLAERLLFSGQFPELLFLMEANFDGLRLLIEEKHAASRLRKWLDPPESLEAYLTGLDKQKQPPLVGVRGAATLWLKGARRVVASGLPDHEERKAKATRLIERVLLAEPFVEYLAKARPYFALKVLQADTCFFTQPFLKMLLKVWLTNRNSVLYEEVKQNQNIGQHDRYIFDPLNPVVSFFFGDLFRAVELGIYKPIGDTISEELKRRHEDPDDSYKMAIRDYQEEGKYHSPLFIGLRLFDFLATEGLHRGVHWHLWIMYLEFWTDHIVDNMHDLPPGVELEREFPTPYHYMLYEIISTQKAWLNTSVELDQTLASVQVKSVDLKAEGVAKTAAISIGRCLRAVVVSPHITRRFKSYILEVVLNGYDIVGQDESRPLARVYSLAVLEGGYESRDYEPYRQGLLQALEILDEEVYRSYMQESGEQLLERLRERLTQ